jgi:hypothetical protein
VTLPSDQNKPPKGTPGDAAHVAIKALIAAIPMMGGPAAELFEAILKPPITHRREEWMERVAEDIRSLADRVEGLEERLRSPVFVTTLMQTTLIALRSDQSEKLDALRNALLNTALADTPNENQLAMFVRFVDELTPLHLKLLSVINDPYAQGVTKTPGVEVAPSPVQAEALRLAFPTAPSSADERELLAQIARELAARGLIDSSNGIFVNERLLSAGIVNVTRLGSAFLSFVSKPPGGG